MTVSIIIPTFNRSSLLVRALESALQQTYADREILLVDDGSTDDTAEVLAPYLERVRYVRQSNQGVSAALNRGIEMANGQWVAVLADDDVWLPAKLESQVRALRFFGEEFGACFTNCTFVGDCARGMTAFEQAKVECGCEFCALDDPHSYVLARHTPLFVQSMLASRALLQKINGFDRQLIIGEDTDLLFRLAFHTRFCLVRAPLVEVDRTPLRSRLTDLYRSKSELRFNCLKHRYQKWLEMPELTNPAIRHAIEQALQHAYFDALTQHVSGFDLKEFKRKTGELKETGISNRTIAATLFRRAVRKLVTSFAGDGNNEATPKAGDSSSRRILTSTAMIGGSNGLVAILRIAQTKALALLLGPTGMGLMGLYSSFADTCSTIGGFGVSSSGVREIGEASGSPDGRSQATAIAALRRLTLVLAAVASAGVLLFRRFASGWVFGSQRYSGAVGVLSLAVLFTIISGSQVAALNGLRRLKDIVRVNLMGAAIATSLTIVLVWFWRERALPYAITSSAAVMLVCSWWFVRRTPRPPSQLHFAEVRSVSLSLLRLGAAFVVAGVTMTGVLLLTKIIIVNRLGMASAGYFQAAWGMVVFSMDFILNAMGVDFYPHLASRTRDRDAANRLVNEQTEVALLLGGPMILSLTLLAPALIFSFYSAKFAAATGLVRWLLLGYILKMISWPMGYLVMAHAKAKTFVFLEILWASTNLGFLYFTVPFAGINAVGYAFVASYLVYTTVLYLLVRRFAGFAWTSKNLILAASISLCAVLALFLVQRAGIVGYLIGGAFTLGLAVSSLRNLYNVVRTHTASGLPARILGLWPFGIQRG